MSTHEHERGLGQERHRGPLRGKERASKIRDPKGRLHTVILVSGRRFQSNHWLYRSDDLISRPDGQVVTTERDVSSKFCALFKLTMCVVPRGAAVVYPKDAGTIVHYADIFPGAVVVGPALGRVLYH